MGIMPLVEIFVNKEDGSWIVQGYVIDPTRGSSVMSGKGVRLHRDIVESKAWQRVCDKMEDYVNASERQPTDLDFLPNYQEKLFYKNNYIVAVQKISGGEISILKYDDIEVDGSGCGEDELILKLPTDSKQFYKTVMDVVGKI